MERHERFFQMAGVLSGDNSVIERSLAGEREAFGGIVAKYQSLVCSVAYSVTGDLALSEDLAQETFLAAWQRLSELRDRGKLGAWLCAIVRNIARDAMRRKKRDLTYDAEPLDENIALAKTVHLSERITQVEREAVMWAALEDIPDTYREPLILFYREGQSVRNVAEALELTEDCVKQRLSRGRKMLKVQVAAFVEESLTSTGPNHAFTAAVMAALPALAMSKSAAAATVTAAAGKGAAATLTVATLGIVLGNLVYMTWGFFGMWTSICNARTLRTRRYMLKVSALSYCSIWGFIGLQGMNGTLLWRSPLAMYTAIGASWVAYLIWLFILVTGSKLKTLRIQEEDLGVRPAPSEPIERTEFSLRRTWLCFAWTISVAFLGSLAFLLWLHGMPWTNVLWGLPFVVLSHGIFVPLFIKGVQMARDENVFSATAPCATSANRRARAHRLSLILGGGMGLVVAPGIWGVGLGILAGDFTSALAIGVVIVTVAAFTARAIERNRAKGDLYMVWSLLFMGFFMPAIIGLKWPAWAAEVNWTISPAYAWASAAVYLGINTCFAISELVLYFNFKGHARPND